LPLFLMSALFKGIKSRLCWRQSRLFPHPSIVISRVTVSTAGKSDNCTTLYSAAVCVDNSLPSLKNISRKEF
jgi:hypothetical protein